mgnify:CR=1 FL=1|tara:strand:+ start:425 stop:655 length:231 start_codon:yes stop_codon:yes gene_type:complete
MNTNIKKLFNQIKNKKEFVFLLAQEFELKPNSIRTGWFSTYYSIPEKHQNRVIEILQNTITQQNNTEKKWSIEKSI